MGKKNLKEFVKQRKRAPGWHGNNNTISNTERRRLGLGELPSLGSTAGRKKGTPNLKKLENGNISNQYGVEFTATEKRNLENAANRANRKRLKMLESEGNLDRIVGGRPTGDKVKSLQAMGKQSDFIISHRHKSLQKFKSKEEYNRYMKTLDRVNSDTYLDDRTREYKRNHIQAIRNLAGDEAKDIEMKIRMMKPAEYRKLIQSNEDLEISYIYDPSERAGKLNQIRNALGMKLKEEPIEDI